MIQQVMRKLIEEVGVDAPSDVVTIHDAVRLLGTPLRASELAAAVLGAQAALICEIWRMRTERQQTAALDLEGAALALRSVKHQRQWKYEITLTEPSYPTVDIYPTDEGDHWVMINGGYPKLRDKLLKVLNCSDSRMAIAASMKKWAAADLEYIAEPERDGDVPDEEGDVLKGICVVMVRSQAQWRDHPQGKVLAKTPVVDIKKLADGPPMDFPDLSKLDPPTGIRPLSGIRVLDLTHVIAGPTCAKTLAEQGATVLHVYGPSRPQMPPFDIDGGHGKLSAFLDLKEKEGADAKTLRELVAGADVFSESYRPGAIAKLGFGPEQLARMKPGIVVVSVSCFGYEGPWAGRRGFEHNAQAATGIANELAINGKPNLTTDFYPNDYITGFLAALGTLAALIRRAREGGSYHVRVSLCRTAMYLLEQGLNADAPTRTDVPASVLVRYMRERDSALGRLHYLGPVLRYSETPSHWDLPPAPLGAHPPHWPDWAV